MIDYCENDNKVNGLTALFQVGDAIMDCPTADVVEVVRCKDCKFRGTDDCPSSYYLECEGDYVDLMEDDDFCSYGTPKNRCGEVKGKKFTEAKNE